MSGGEHFLKEMSTIRAKTRATTTTTTTKKAGRIFTHFLLRKKLLDFTFHGRVPMVLDSIIGSPRKELGNLNDFLPAADRGNRGNIDGNSGDQWTIRRRMTFFIAHLAHSGGSRDSDEDQEQDVARH